MKLKELFSFRFYIKKLLELKDRPEETARGLALGVFIGFLPVNGFQVLIAITIAAFAKASKIAAAIGTHVTNPWTTVPVLVIDYYVGCRILRLLGYQVMRVSLSTFSLSRIFSAGLALLAPTFVGGASLGLIFSILSYFGFKKLVENIREKQNAETA
ncbi:DUF2062 domain-containing protein [Desulfurobacterium sp. TC5-1]|uniref:DUF2062 domain-containing protein n=1 Tax=Desulfurobacterium sp. TC5-1 TaxID=1158318 RepID=UPI0003B7211C|nr:DUF2062 domain-containing protein [Desulfurobacterium sp. TC5-1]